MVYRIKTNKEIEEYWDEKTTFVHRRAFLIGVALGMFLGVDLVLFVIVVMTECGVI